VRDAEVVTGAPELPLHHVADAVLAQLVGRYRVSVDEDRDRAQALDRPPTPHLVRVVRLVPEGTDGESLTVALTAAGGVTVHVRRSLVLDLAPDAPDLEPRLLAIAGGLGWSRRG
jgi:hypothetical protein